MKEKIIISLAQKRNTTGITFNDLALKTGIDKSNLVKIFSGKSNPTLDTLTKIAEALEVNLIIKENN